MSCTAAQNPTCDVCLSPYDTFSKRAKDVEKKSVCIADGYVRNADNSAGTRYLIKHVDTLKDGQMVFERNDNVKYTCAPDDTLAKCMGLPYKHSPLITKSTRERCTYELQYEDIENVTIGELPLNEVTCVVKPVLLLWPSVIDPGADDDKIVPLRAELAKGSNDQTEVTVYGEEKNDMKVCSAGTKLEKCVDDLNAWSAYQIAGVVAGVGSVGVIGKNLYTDFTEDRRNARSRAEAARAEAERREDRKRALRREDRTNHLRGEHGSVERPMRTFHRE